PEIKDIKDYSYPIMPPFPAIPDNYPIIPDQSHNGFKFINNGQLFINSWQINYYTFPLTNDVYIKDILFGSNNTFTIDTGNENRSIVVDRLHLDGMLKIKGEGKLTIYVKEELNLSQGEIGSLDKINNLNIFYDGNKDLNI